MGRPRFFHHFVARWFPPFPLQPLLQFALGIVVAAGRQSRRDFVGKPRGENRPDGGGAAVAPQRAQHRFEGIGQQRIPVAPALPRFAAPQQHEPAQIQAARHPRQRRRVRQAAAHLGQLALPPIGPVFHQPFGGDGAQHRVAQEFQPLAFGQLGLAGFRRIGAVGQRGGQPFRPRERMPQPLGQFRRVRMRCVRFHVQALGWYCRCTACRRPWSTWV